MEDEIIPEKLIPLVQERPIIWDKTSDHYRDLKQKHWAWREIYTTLNPAFPQWSNEKKDIFGKIVNSKWTNLRDAYMRAEKKAKFDRKRGKPYRPYHYNDLLKFLNNKKRKRSSSFDKPNVEIIVKEEPIEEDTEKTAEAGSSSQMSWERNQMSPEIKWSSDVDEKPSKYLCVKVKDVTEENPHLSFFKGVLPSVDTFDEDETLEFQAGVLALIRSIRRKRGVPQ